jgi:hypothetical protein
MNIEVWKHYQFELIITQHLRKTFILLCAYLKYLCDTETSPSLWEIEFAKQLATVNKQPFQNGFEEMIQWTKEGKLWEFPINNEAGKC